MDEGHFGIPSCRYVVMVVPVHGSEYDMDSSFFSFSFFFSFKLTASDPC